ncbi:MAG: DinB family protein [Candidatus Sumerlaeaceae bacterium]|nr:DinB family protein [Candidatus Sumerlaeaceae bacterium]
MITPEIVIESFKAVRANTIEIARDIPEDQFTFSPVDPMPTVLEQFHSILRITEFMVGIALHEGEVSFDAAPREEWFAKLTTTNLHYVKTPAEVVGALQLSIQNIEKRVLAAGADFLNQEVKAPDNRTKLRLWIVNCAKEQEMVRRGQLFLYERMLGIVPHTTRRQQEREAQKSKG